MRKKLREMYEEEREETVRRMIEILDLDEENSFYLNEIDADTEKQDKIMTLKPAVKKYYSTGEIAFRPDKDVKRPYLLLIRGLLRVHKYKIINKPKSILREDNTRMATMQYIIFSECVI